MSVEQFEDYLASKFVTWANTATEAGVRYQFRSPDAENSRALFEAFERVADGRIMDGEIALPYIGCGDIQLIPVLHRSDADDPRGFSENYISHLRDQVAGQRIPFTKAALLVIHNSMLDTLINSAENLADRGAIWNPKELERELGALVDPFSDTKELSLCLLKDQLAIITEDKATIFGFKVLYHSLRTGKLHFNELGLFDDPGLLVMNGQPKQIRKRLDENRKLRQSIESNVEHYSDQLESVLTDFSSKFIKKHFGEDGDWRQLTFDTFEQEKRANQAQTLVFLEEEVSGSYADVFLRAKSTTKAGQREQSLIIQVEQDLPEVTLELIFDGIDLTSGQVKLKDNKSLLDGCQLDVSRIPSSKKCRLEAKLPFDGKPTYFSLILQRDKRSEQYKFRCLMMQKGQFDLDEIKTCYWVEPGKSKQWLTLQLDDNKLKINNTLTETCELSSEDDVVDVSEFGFVDFEALANESELIQFSIESGDAQLKLNIEGQPAEEGVITPLLFAQSRFNRLLRDEANAEFNQAKKRIIVDNRESPVTGAKFDFLNWEQQSRLEQKLHWTATSHFTLTELSTSFPALADAYRALFNYLDEHNTLPSLVAWGENYCALAQVVVDEFEAVLPMQATNSPLSTEQRQLLRIGTIEQQDSDNFQEYIASWHPLVLAYNLKLARELVVEKQFGHSSFASLPKVTLERLVASGLIPYVYHPISGFAHVVPAKENCFWLELIPHKEANFGYVKRLVKDKLAEFTKAYERLFAAGPQSALNINAINQLDAEELFLGVIDHFKRHLSDSPAIHVNFYDDKLQHNAFDRFAETASIEDLKQWMGLNKGSLSAEADLIIDLIRSRLSYSKFETPRDGESLAYAHLAFFKNNAPVDCCQVNVEDALSGVLCDGLIAGEAAETKGGSYFTSFGLRNVDVSAYQPLRLARLLGNLWQPARQINQQYLGHGVGLAVSADFKELLNRSYDSALWTTVIDPKVTLDFFTSQKDVVLIHYSDQYTSSAGYDAITVTKEVDLFKRLLQRESQSAANNLLSEFNAFNGEWLLNMLISNDKDRKEKHGIIGAYKFVSVMLREADISWVPLSVAEMIRVSGNVGLKMSDSEFSRHVHGYKKGAISDDVLFVGFKEQTLYLLPLEVKAGVRPDFKYAGEQAKELLRYLKDEVLGADTLAGCLYRGLFIRQVLMQVEKLKLYNVLTEGSVKTLMDHREWWLKGDYNVASTPEYYDGIVLAHLSSDSCFGASFKKTDSNVLQIELPYAWLTHLVDNSANTLPCEIPAEHLPMKITSQEEVESEAEQKLILDVQGGDEDRTVRIPSKPNDDSLKVLLGYDVLHNKPMLWEPTNTAKFMNSNTGIIGTMGTGKTQCTKSVVTQLYRNQHNNVNGKPIGMLIFDYKSDYVDDDFINATSAKKYKLFKLPYNPLSLFGDMPMLPIHTAAGFSETMARAYGLGKKQQLKLENIILEAYELAGIRSEDPSTWSKPAPTIENLWDIFLDQEKIEEDSLYAALSKLARFKIFESDPEQMVSLYELIDGITVIELAGYPSEIQNLIVALTLDLFYSQMQKQGKPEVNGDYRQMTKMILVDEADNFMSQNFPSLRKVLKEGREYGVGVILSTQDITHFKTGDNDYSAYILTWIVHRVAQIKNQDIKAIFNKDDKAGQESLMNSIRELEKHNSLYVDGEKRIVKMKDQAFWELLQPSN